MFGHLGNVFLLSAAVLAPLPAPGGAPESPAPENLPLADLAEAFGEDGPAAIAAIGAKRQEALEHLQEGQPEAALLLYEECMPQWERFAEESRAALLGQYVWLRLRCGRAESLPPWLLLRLRADPALLGHLPTWEAIWNLLQVLAQPGAFEKALQFFQSVKVLAEGVPLPSEEVMVYNLFAETCLLFRCHYLHTSHLKARELWERHHTLGDPVLREHLQMQLLLHLGELEVLPGRDAIGTLHLKILQERFPGTVPDVRSRLFLAEHHAARRDPDAAEALLQDFIDRHPSSPHRPRMLYALARQLRRRGFGHYPSVAAVLERIVHDYPDSEFYLPARLAEGELLRELHQFFGAQMLYEDLLRRRDLPEALRAWVQLLRIRCVLALHPDDRAGQEKALALLNSIAQGPRIPRELRAEVQFQQMWLLFQHQRFFETRPITSRVFADFSARTSLPPREGYWLRRILQISCRVAELENDEDSGRKLRDLWERLPPPVPPAPGD